MKAWLIYDKDMAEYNKHYIAAYKSEGNKRGIEFEVLFSEYINFGIQKNTWFIRYRGNSVTFPEFIICRCINPLLNRHLELLGLKVYNNSFVADICNDKAKTYQYVANTQIPMIDSIFCKNTYLKTNIESFTTETVIKSVNGHGGSQVFYRKDNSYDEEIQKIMKSDDVVIQPFVGKNHQDLRVYVIGTEIISAVLRTASEGFRSNYSLGGTVSLYTLSEQEKRLVHKIINIFEFGLVGIDFILGDQGQLVFNEIEDVVGSRMLYQCSDINIVALYLDYIAENLKKMN